LHSQGLRWERLFCYNCVVVVLALPPLTPAPLVELHAVVDAIAKEDVSGFDDAALGDDLIALRREIDRLELEFSRRLRRVDLHHGNLDTQLSLTSWLRSRCRLSVAAAAQHVDVARRLPELPATERSAAEGSIGFHHCAVIARCATQVGTDAVRAVEDTLVEAATKLDPRGLGVVTQRLRYCVDPDGAAEDADAQHTRRRFDISQTFDGVFHISGLLDAEGGALVRTAIDALDAPIAGDTRPAWQRRADAIVELARRQLQGGTLPSVAGERPHLTVTASEATLRLERSCAPGEMRWAGPVIADTVRRIACDASVTRIALGADGEPLSVGRATRTIPPAMRRALVLRDGGCRYPGCDRPPEWTDGHHIEHWADGGETKLDNLVLLCRQHHRAVHEGRWRLALGRDGETTALPP
jgi:Domain of unknown function (DUF222)/HNH endonuclease